MDVPAAGSIPGSGIPVTLSNGAGVSSVEFDLDYDAALLSINSVQRGAGLPVGVRIASTGYRIVSEASCPSPPSREKREGVVQSLASLPTCKL